MHTQLVHLAHDVRQITLTVGVSLTVYLLASGLYALVSRLVLSPLERVLSVKRTPRI